MFRGAVGPFRRLMSAVLLVALSLPVAFELAAHQRDPISIGPVHVESASVRHHADDCLSSVSPSPRSISVEAFAQFFTLAARPADPPAPPAAVVSQEPQHPSRSRAPPTRVA